MKSFLILYKNEIHFDTHTWISFVKKIAFLDAQIRLVFKGNIKEDI